MEVAPQKNSRDTQRSSEGGTGERVSQKHQQQGNDAHNMGETKKIETYKATSKKSEAAEKHENLRLEHSTARSRLMRTARVQLHVHDGLVSTATDTTA